MFSTIAPLFARRSGFNVNDITKIALTIVSIIFSSASNWMSLLEMPLGREYVVGRWKGS